MWLSVSLQSLHSRPEPGSAAPPAPGSAPRTGTGLRWFHFSAPLGAVSNGLQDGRDLDDELGDDLDDSDDDPYDLDGGMNGNDVLNVDLSDDDMEDLEDGDFDSFEEDDLI